MFWMHFSWIKVHLISCVLVLVLCEAVLKEIYNENWWHLSFEILVVCFLHQSLGVLPCVFLVIQVLCKHKLKPVLFLSCCLCAQLFLTGTCFIHVSTIEIDVIQKLTAAANQFNVMKVGLGNCRHNLSFCTQFSAIEILRIQIKVQTMSDSEHPLWALRCSQFSVSHPTSERPVLIV